MNKSIYKFLIISSFGLFFSCQDILECIINRHPELQDKTLEIGTVGQHYYEVIHASINNEPLDNSYEYYFYIADNLPEGMTITVDYREVIIHGYPNSSGTFEIDIRLQAEQYNDYYDDCESRYNDCDGLCSEETSRTYTLRIL